MDESFGLWLLVANFICVKRALRQNDLDSRCRSNTSILILHLGGVSIWVARSCLRIILLDHEKRVDLVDVAKSISRDQGDRDGLVHTLVQCLQSHSATTLETSHHE